MNASPAFCVLICVVAAACSTVGFVSRKTPPDTFTDCAVCPEMALLPAGTFTMGSSDEEVGRSSDEGPQRRVSVPAFAVGRYEVTVGEWDAFVAETGRPDPEVTGESRCVWRDPGFAQDRTHPVVCVNAHDAADYAAWLSAVSGHRYRLLSEAEWEYAARAGTHTMFSTGDAITREQVQTGIDGHTPSGTAPVGSFPPNAFGLHDMHGNAWEWVEDCYAASYEAAPRDGSAVARPGCTERVARGGSWVDFPQAVRSAKRSGISPGLRFDTLGFRVARAID